MATVRTHTVLITFCALITVVSGLTANSATAATLWISTAHTARVTAGATTVLTGNDIVWTSGTAAINNCADATLNMTVVRNDDTAVIGSLTGSTWNSCSPFSITGTHTTPWTLTVAGTSFVSATSTCWNSGIDRFTYDLANGDYAGNLTTGVTACQPTAGGSPISIRLVRAGTFSGPLCGSCVLDGTLVTTGAAAGWSLTN